MTGAKGQAPVRERGARSSCLMWPAPAASRAGPPASGRGVFPRAALGVLGAATVAVLGMSAAGIDLVRPAAARGAPLPLNAAAAEAAPAAAMPAAPARIALIATLSEVPRRDARRRAAAGRTRAPVPTPPVGLRESAWQEAVAVPDRPVAVVLRPAAAGARPAPPPAPKMKPRVVARVSPADAPPPVVQKPRTSGSSAAAVIARFDSVGYDLAAVRAAARPVPRIYLDALPDDLAHVSSAAAKKHLFVQAVLPVILQVNEELAAARGRAERLVDRIMWTGALAPADREWLLATAERYGTAPFDVPSLLKRLDGVPPSLALAQAVMESGVGHLPLRPGGERALRSIHLQVRDRHGAEETRCGQPASRAPPRQSARGGTGLCPQSQHPPGL